MTKKGDLQPFKRLDQAMVAYGLAETRSRASDAIARGVVFVDGVKALKAALKVSATAKITLDDPAQSYVSRAALKLKAGLEAFEFSPDGLHILDIGASTGGFSQVLLEHGAARIFAVDVGHNQLHPLIKDDARVTNLEGLNVRHLTLDDLGARMDAIVCDVSFISLKLALPLALGLVEVGAWGVFLVKPQFEVGRDAIGKGGIVSDIKKAEEVAEAIVQWVNQQSGWSVRDLIPSPIKGSDGNQEYLLGAIFNGA